MIEKILWRGVKASHENRSDPRTQRNICVDEGREHYMPFPHVSWNLNDFSHEVQGVARQLEPQLLLLAPCLLVLQTHKHDTWLAHGRQVLIATLERLR
jgi:hypothetical protein